MFVCEHFYFLLLEPNFWVVKIRGACLWLHSLFEFRVFCLPRLKNVHWTVVFVGIAKPELYEIGCSFAKFRLLRETEKLLQNK